MPLSPTATLPSRESREPLRWQCTFRHSLQTTGELCVILITHPVKKVRKEKQRSCFLPSETPCVQAEDGSRVSPNAEGESCRAACFYFQACLRSGILMGWGIPLNEPIILLISLSNGPWLCSNGVKCLGADLVCQSFHLGSCKNRDVISIT